MADTDNGKDQVKGDACTVKGAEVVDILLKEVEGLTVVGPPAAKRARVSSCALGRAVDVSSLAALVMRGMRVHIAGKSHRILEIELYLTGPGHLDPYTHCSAVQVTLPSVDFCLCSEEEKKERETAKMGYLSFLLLLLLLLLLTITLVQSECGKWYFHRLGNGGYRGGSYKVCVQSKYEEERRRGREGRWP